jgi:membrane protease YdiL (CAAX protease family)
MEPEEEPASVCNAPHGGGAARGVRRVLAAGATLYLVALAALAVVTDLPVQDLLALPVFLVLLPALAVAQLPLLDDDEEVERIPAYLGSVAGIALIGVAGLILGLWMVGGEELGLVLLPPVDLLLWSAGLTVGGVAVVAIFQRWENRAPRSRESLLLKLLPRTGREKGVWVLLSFTAGTGEELAYRGYVLVALMAGGFSPLAAAVGSSVSFGVLHVYQGRIGIVRSGVLGFGFAWAVLATGSLVPVMVAHTALDLLGGLVLGERWLGGSLAEGGDPG